jgi:sulfide dehydrogenase cytochrome subunit
MDTRLLTLAAVVALVGMPLIADSADAPASANLCTHCHGQSAPSPHPDVPTIHGLPEIVIDIALYDFRGGVRPCRPPACAEAGECPAQSMCDVAKPLLEEDVEALARWYGAQSFVPAAESFDPALAAKGRVLHDEQCEICHSAGGTDPQDEASLLRGQHMEYIRTALEDFREGRRTAVEPMDRKIRALTPQELEALAHFYASPVEGDG